MALRVQAPALRLSAPVLALFAAGAWGGETGVTELAPVEVRASVRAHTALREAQELAGRVAGNATVLAPEAYRDGAVASMHDALLRTPAAYVQNPAGMVSSRISMRGSGLTSTTGVRGVRLLRDGLPLSRIDDLGDSIFADPLTVEFMEILPGANAQGYGAATLGGAINLVSPTGRNQPGWRLGLSGGAYGYLNSRVQGGEDFGNGLDAFVSAQSTRSDGAREQSAYALNRYYGNVGYALSATSRGRLHYSQEYFRVGLPGALTRDQLDENPRAANPQALRADANIRTMPRWRVAYVHEWDLRERDRLSLGVYHTGTRYRSAGVSNDTLYDAVDYGLALRHEWHGSLADKAGTLTWGVNLGRGRDHNSATWPATPASAALRPLAGTPLAGIEGRRSNVEAYAQWRWQLAPRWALIVGGQGARALRATDNQVAPPARAWFAQGSASQTYTGFSPRVGFVWDAAPDAQVFGNLSGSFEPPNSIHVLSPGGVLEAQRATTLELGTRGGTRRFRWEATVYHAWVRDEIIEIPLPGSFEVSTAHNADKTRHVGLEMGLSGEYGLGRWGVAGLLDWSLAYTWNEFRFDADPVFGNNRLPGIPEHFARLSLRYRHPSGFYVGPSLEIASGWNVDQANSLRAPGYAVLNATMGYQSPDKRWTVYLDLRNLTNRPYAAATEYVVDARGIGDPSVYLPGTARMAFAGLEWHW